MAIKRCVVCDKKFLALGRDKTCGPEHARKHKTERDAKPKSIKQCRICFGEFTGRGKTCSPNHSKAYRAKWAREQRASDPEKFRGKERERYWTDIEKSRSMVRKKQRKYRASTPNRVPVERALLTAAVNFVGEMQISRGNDSSPGTQREYLRNWHRDNPEKASGYSRKHRTTDVERYNLDARNRYAKRRAALRIVKLLQKGIMP